MLALALAASVVVSLADGSPPRDVARLDVEWLRGATVVSRGEGQLLEGSLTLPGVPAGADAYRVVGPALMSRRTALHGSSGRLVLVTAAVLVVEKPAEGGSLLLLEDEPGAEPRTIDLPTAAGPTSVPVWPATWGVVVDSGPDRPLRVDRVRLDPGGRHVLQGPREKGRSAAGPLVVIVRDEHGAPLTGVSIRVPAEGTVEERALLFALARRTKPSGEDGRIEVGSLDDRAGRIRFRRDGYRDGVFEVPRADVRTKPGRLTLRRLAGVDFSWTAQPERAAGAEVSAERCLSAPEPSGCISWTCSGSARFGAEGRGRFDRLEPGWYRFSLRTGGSSIAYEEREVPWDSAAPEPAEISFAPDDWRLAGRVLDPDDRPVSNAVVDAAPIVSRGYAPPASIEARSGADGSFVLEFVASFAEVGLTARSDDPVGATRLVRVSKADRWSGDLTLRLVGGGLSVEVLAREDDAPLEGCRVTLRIERSGAADMRSARTDADGKALFRGLGEGTLVLDAGCRGRVPATGTVLESNAGAAATTLRLEKASAVWLRVVDVGGRAVGSAKAFVPEPGPFGNAFESRVALAGVTGPDGRLELPGDELGGSPVFVVAEGRALGVARLSASRCGAGCETTVELRQPGAFPGATATSASGRALPPNGLVFSYAGIPLPFALLEHVAAANGFGPAGFFAGDGEWAMNLFPGYLAPGDYEVGYLIGSKTTRRLKAVPAGYLRLPSAELVELRVHSVP